jgi:hypothetical protein
LSSSKSFSLDWAGLCYFFAWTCIYMLASLYQNTCRRHNV